MHLLRWIPLIVTLLVAAGCTRSPEAVESRRQRDVPESPARPQQTDTRPVIVAFGDSISEGLGVETGSSFPDQLQKKLDKNGFRYHVVNMGVSGDTTSGGLGRLDYALSLKPSIIILELGGNDGLRGVPVTSTKANLEKMIVAMQKNGASVLLAE